MKKIYSLLAAMTLMTSSTFATTIYCKMAQDWWKADGAAVGAYAWKGDGDSADKNANWPGVRMTATGEADVWSVDIDLTKYEKIIFTRVNGSGDVADWGAKTKDLVLPTDGKNLFTITTSTAVWGDPGCDGEWSVLGDEPGPGPQPQPVGDHDYYLKGYRGPTKGDIETPSMEEYFECGVLADYAFDGDAMLGKGHFFILVCDPGQTVGVCYMAKGDVDGTHCTLYNQNETPGANGKLMINPPSATFYLYDNGDGTLELSIEELAGKTLVGNCGGGGSTPGEQEAVENTKAVVKARKAIIDGRLVIIRGEQMFDATGRAL